MSIPPAQPTAPAPPAPFPADPPKRRRKKQNRLPHLDHCLNCGTATGEQDNYCPRCGQENENETVALKPLLGDILSEIASWDSKLVRTALPLLFRPGFLTNEYNAGRRIRYLSPLKMYLVISAFFFLAAAPMQNDLIHIDSKKPAAKQAGTGPHLHASLGLNTQSQPKTTDDDDLSSLHLFGDNRSLGDLPKTVAAYDAQQKDPRNPHKDSLPMQILLRQSIKANQDKQTFVQSLSQAIWNDLPKMMFVLLPLFAMLLKLTYLRAKRFYVEHLIFALHSHAFTFALMTLGTVLPHHILGFSHWGVIRPWIIAFLIFSLPIYLFTAMQRVYKQPWWKTFLKFNWLAFNYVILLSLSFVFTAVIAFLLA